MRAPILVFEGENVEAFASAEDAALYLEPVDVNNGTYEAYDSCGARLNLSIAAVAHSQHGMKGALDRLFRIRPPECVVIAQDERFPQNVSELRCRLIKSINRVHNVAEEELSNEPLEALVSRIPVVT